MKYAVIYETGPEGGYSAYVPDLPGSVARREHERKLASSWKGRSNSISEDAIAGEAVPRPSSLAEMLELA